MSEQRNYERYCEQIIARLGELVRDRTLRSKFFDINGALLLDEIRAYYFRKLGRRAEGLSTRTSTYYAAAGDMYARFTNSFVMKPLWGFLGLTCRWRFRKLSDALMREVGGFDLLDQNMANVYVYTVLEQGRHEEAMRLAEALLSRQGLSNDNTALMMRVRAEVFCLREDYTRAQVELQHITGLPEELRPLTRVRVLRTWGVMHDRQGNKIFADAYFEQALSIAKEHDFQGQILKIMARQ